jgi:hypothetical protein
MIEDDIEAMIGFVDRSDETTKKLIAEVRRLRNLLDNRPAVNAALAAEFMKWTAVVHDSDIAAARATAEQRSVPSTHGAFHTGVIVKLLLDEAFKILRTNSPEDCPEEPHMRVALGKKFWAILDGEKK